MKTHELETRPQAASRLLRQIEEEEEEPKSTGLIARQWDPMAQWVSKDKSKHESDARRATFQRSVAGSPSSAADSMLRLQKTYGNRYAQTLIARAAEGSEPSEVAPEVENAIQRERGGGQTLDNGVRAQMEPAFGANFGGVRIHIDGQADNLNRSLRARAFTIGQDLFFREGTYQPNTSAGRELIAHELAHVVQQSRGPVGSAKGGRVTLNSDLALERSANEMATAIVEKDSASARPAGAALQTSLWESSGGIVQRNGPEGEQEETTPVASQSSPTVEAAPTPVAPRQALPGSPVQTLQPASHQVYWNIDYEQTIPGPRANETPATRRTDHVLFIDVLNMRPSPRISEAGLQFPSVVTFRGMNPLSAGAALLGPENHPRDLNGEATGVIRYGTRSNLDLHCDFTGVSAAEQRTVTRQLTSRMSELLDSARGVGDVEEILRIEGARLLSNGTLDRVIVRSVRAERLTRHRLPTVAYGTIDSDKLIDAEILIQSERDEQQYQYDTTEEERQRVRATEGESTSILERVTNVSQTATQVSHQIAATARTAITHAIENMRQTRSQTTLRGTGRTNFGTTGRINLGAGAEAEADLSQILGALLRTGFLRRLARLTLPDGVTVALNLTGGVEGETTFGVEAEVTAEQTVTNEQLSRITTTTERMNQIEEQVRTVVETSVSTTIERGQTQTRSSEVGAEADRGHTMRQSVSGTRIRYRNPLPVLRIRGMRP